MALLAAFCGNCAQVTLLEQSRLLNDRLPCATCGGPLRVAPSCSFSERDRGLFEDLKQIVHESRFDAADARSTALRIATVLRAGADYALLEQLTARLPGLLPIQTAAGSNQQASQRVLRLLRAILEATAVTESSS